MATFVKRILSGSTNGRGIKVAATASAGTTIHTAIAGTTAGTYDEIWLWAMNAHTGDLVLTLEFGGTTDPNDRIIQTIPTRIGLYPLLPGLPLQNGCIVKAYAGTANLVIIHGFVNSITD
jgi:hypothetical protein